MYNYKCIKLNMNIYAILLFVLLNKFANSFYVLSHLRESILFYPIEHFENTSVKSSFILPNFRNTNF